MGLNGIMRYLNRPLPIGGEYLNFTAIQKASEFNLLGTQCVRDSLRDDPLTKIAPVPMVLGQSENKVLLKNLNTSFDHGN